MEAPETERASPPSSRRPDADNISRLSTTSSRERSRSRSVSRDHHRDKSRSVSVPKPYKDRYRPPESRPSSSSSHKNAETPRERRSVSAIKEPAPAPQIRSCSVNIGGSSVSNSAAVTESGCLKRSAPDAAVSMQAKQRKPDTTTTPEKSASFGGLKSPRSAPASVIRSSPPQRKNPDATHYRATIEDLRRLQNILDPHHAVDERDTTAFSEAHPAGLCGPLAALRQAVDLSVQQPSIIVGAPSSSVALNAGDFHAQVVMLYGSQATVLDTAAESMRDTCNSMIAYTNSIDASCPDTRVKLDRTERRHVSNYRYRLALSASQYNEVVPSELRARYYKGAIHFATAVIGTMFRTSDELTYTWTTLLVPRVSNIPGGQFLLCSLKGNAAVCQPTVTTGGPHTILLAHDPSNVPPDNRPVRLELSAFFFVPYVAPDFGVRMLTLEDAAIRASGISFGIMTPVRRTGGVCIGLFSALSWTPRTIMNENGVSTTSYVAWFECTQENSYSLCKYWRPYRKVTYECGDFEAGINVESMYVVDGGRRLIGTLVVGSDTTTNTSSLSPELMPSMIVLRFELCNSRHREPTIVFSTNPTLHLTWPSESPDDPITMYAPYDLCFREGKCAVFMDIRYAKAADNRCFFISGVPGEYRFHTGLTVWRPQSPIRLSLISPTPSLHICRGTPIARLFFMHSTEGNIYQHNERTATRVIKTGDRINLHLGDLRLPYQNFTTSDEL
ncbi:m31 protein [Murid betaherpesvirus 1]|uniref:M31 protein n=3 Tax=Murid herpesvirus 1 TaxID=10366 RepID=H2A1P9_MUHV1|nr:M31 [Muromegalovirus C4A]CCE56867.1 m31 protein [Murid betaherpesvirus 1]